LTRYFVSFSRALRVALVEQLAYVVVDELAGGRG